MSFSKTMARYEKWPLEKLIEAERAGWEELKAQISAVVSSFSGGPFGPAHRRREVSVVVVRGDAPALLLGSSRNSPRR